MQRETVKNEPRLLLKIEEAGNLLGFSRAKAYQMANSGELPGVLRIGRSVRVNAASLRAWVHANSGTSGHPGAVIETR